jgi:hypothetical protein
MVLHGTNDSRDITLLLTVIVDADAHAGSLWNGLAGHGTAFSTAHGSQKCTRFAKNGTKLVSLWRLKSTQWTCRDPIRYVFGTRTVGARWTERNKAKKITNEIRNYSRQKSIRRSSTCSPAKAPIDTHDAHSLLV